MSRRASVVRAAKRFCRIAYHMVAGRQVFRHPSCRERHYIIQKLFIFYCEHETSMEQVRRDLSEAGDWIPRGEYAAEAERLPGGLPSAPRADGRSRGGSTLPRRSTADLEWTSNRAASAQCDPARGLTPTGGEVGRIERVRGDRPHLTAMACGPNNASNPRGGLTP